VGRKVGILRKKLEVKHPLDAQYWGKSSSPKIIDLGRYYSILHGNKSIFSKERMEKKSELNIDDLKVDPCQEKRIPRQFL